MQSNANFLQGKTAAVTGAASGIGRASTEALLAAGAEVVMIDRDPNNLAALQDQHGTALRSLCIDLLDPQVCATLIPQLREQCSRIDIFHANAGLYLGGDLSQSTNEDIDALLQLNINVVMKNVHDLLPIMRAQGEGDIIVTGSLAAHYPTPWEPVYAASKWALQAFVQIVRRQVRQQGIRVASVSPGPVITALLDDWPEDRLEKAKAEGSLMEASEVAEALLFMLSRPRHVTIRDMIIMPSGFDL